VEDNVTTLISFGAGVVSFLSPCVLPMVPVYLASLYGQEALDERGFRLPVFLHSLGFVFGFSVVFVSLGTVAGLTGYAVIPDHSLLTRIGGGLLVAFGVLTLAAMKVPWLNYEKRLTIKPGKVTGYFRSFVIGGIFSLGWTACVGPVLGSILTIAAVKATAWRGAYLLAVYSLGLGIPFLAAGIAFDYLRPALKHLNKYTVIIRIASGLILILAGILTLTGQLTWLSSLTT
jgi:cytochrome c-type biogenesis protein